MASPSPESNHPPPPWVPLETEDCSLGFCSPYCPQWCYVLFPPPPPFSFDQETADSSSAGQTFSPLVIAVIGILASAFLLTAYYTVLSKFCGPSLIRGCRRRLRRRGAPPGPGGSESDSEDPAGRSARRRHEQEWHLPPTVGLDEALISKIAVCKYKRGDGLVGCTDCSVCLGEFREGESLRLLPKCGHAFHVQCIDTWLKSHSNCPLCRAGIVVLVSPAPLALPPAPPDHPVSQTSDETAAAVVGGSTEGSAGLENDGEDSTKEISQMRRSFSMGSFRRVSVVVADDRSIKEAVDDETMVGGSSSRESDEAEHSKQGSGSSTGRFCLTRQGRGRNSLLPI